MSLQVLWMVVQGHAAQWLNGLAMFFAIAGSWLAIATRVRVQRAAALGSALSRAWDESDPVLRLNRFFYVFAFVTLGMALTLSWWSTTL
ncbi:hypothetical protein [Pseudomonas sp. TTU2014-080ASC]|uniref:hypothetical protein n=1 Tax=Pseudomonas sp. TTU2014-080ASC TaxID=1729724 RepID=UPI0007187D09|nr:hypothetical protein [Pseudomonas sp. TTU2014-080ASC]KRW58602.1 hypothetical protein AO726_17340 [Pseudomonas sp. TTU2014-080ASC]